MEMEVRLDAALKQVVAIVSRQVVNARRMVTNMSETIRTHSHKNLKRRNLPDRAGGGHERPR